MILVGPPVVKGHCKMSRKTIKHRVPDVKRQFLSMTSLTIDVSGMVILDLMGSIKPINFEKLFIQPKNVWESSTLMYLLSLAEQYFGNWNFGN